jgi:uncharacterized protein YecT (DUF1311 family)
MSSRSRVAAAGSVSRRVALACAALAVVTPLAASARDECAAPATQAAMNHCAQQALLASRAREAQAIRQLEQGLSSAQRESFRASQRAWARWRSAQCAFESGASAGGSVRPMVEAQCATRLTEARTAEIARLTNCPEGDFGCPRRPR